MSALYLNALYVNALYVNALYVSGKPGGPQKTRANLVGAAAQTGAVSTEKSVPWYIYYINALQTALLRICAYMKKKNKKYEY